MQAILNDLYISIRLRRKLVKSGKNNNRRIAIEWYFIGNVEIQHSNISTYRHVNLPWKSPTFASQVFMQMRIPMPSLSELRRIRAGHPGLNSRWVELRLNSYPPFGGSGGDNLCKSFFTIVGTSWTHRYHTASLSVATTSSRGW